MERFTNAAFSFEVTDAAAAGQDGAEAVAILLHGFPQDRRCWDRVTSALADGGYRVLAPDLRGYSPGARPAARSAYRNSQLAADVLALADAAGAEQFHLAGHDWGAALAWYVAGRYPGRVTSLAALSVPHPQAFAQALISGDQAARSWYMAACQLPWLPERVLGRRGGQAFRDILVRTGLDPASAGRYAARARDPAVLRGPLNWYRAMPFSLREPAGPIRVPTMFAWGNRDQFVSRTGAELCGRCSRSTSPRRPDRCVCRRAPTGNSGIHRRDLRLAEQRTTFSSLLENTTIEPSVRSINMNPRASSHCSFGSIGVTGSTGR